MAERKFSFLPDASGSRGRLVVAMTTNSNTDTLPNLRPSAFPLSSAQVLARQFPPPDGVKWRRKELTDLLKLWSMSLTGEYESCYVVTSGKETRVKCGRNESCEGRMRIKFEKGTASFGEVLDSNPCTCSMPTTLPGQMSTADGEIVAPSLNDCLVATVCELYKRGIPVVSHRLTNYGRRPETPNVRPPKKARTKKSKEVFFLLAEDNRWFSVQFEQQAGGFSPIDLPDGLEALLSRSGTVAEDEAHEADNVAQDEAREKDDEEKRCLICLSTPACVYLLCPEAMKKSVIHTKFCLPCMQRNTLEASRGENSEFLRLTKTKEMRCLICRSPSSQYGLTAGDSKQSMPLPFPLGFAGKLPFHSIEELKVKARALDCIVAPLWQDWEFCREDYEDAQAKLDSLAAGGHGAVGIAAAKAKRDRLRKEFNRFKLPVWADMSSEDFDPSKPVPFQNFTGNAVYEHLKGFDLGVDPRNVRPLRSAAHSFVSVDRYLGPVENWIRTYESHSKDLDKNLRRGSDAAFRQVQLKRLLVDANSAAKSAWIKARFVEGKTIAWIRNNIDNFDAVGGQDDDDSSFVELVDGPSGDGGEGGDEDYVPSGRSEDTDDSSVL